MLNVTAKVELRHAATRSLKLRNTPQLFFSRIRALSLLNDWGLMPR